MYYLRKDFRGGKGKVCGEAFVEGFFFLGLDCGGFFSFFFSVGRVLPRPFFNGCTLVVTSSWVVVFFGRSIARGTPLGLTRNHG